MKYPPARYVLRCLEPNCNYRLKIREQLARTRKSHIAESKHQRRMLSRYALHGITNQG